jgi:3-oxoacyl-[acyl-carrier-protein] synthase-3
MSRRIAAKITGVSGFVPPRVMTNADLSKLVETDDAWIQQRVGIRERHVAEKGVGASDLATAAARQLLCSRKVPASEIDLIVVASVTPDMMFPATACLVQNNLGATRAWGFDLSAACSGFLYALTVGAQFVGAGTQKKALVIGSDVMTSILDYKDRATCVLFGDGAGAVLLEPTENENEGILDFVHDVDGSGGKFLYMPGGGSLHPASHETIRRHMHFIKMKGNETFKAAVRALECVVQEALEHNKVNPEEIDFLVPHQANLRIIQAMAQRLNMPMEKVVLNLPKYGNTSAASIPMALDEAVRDGRIKENHLLLLEAFGGGLTWASALVRW